MLRGVAHGLWVGLIAGGIDLASCGPVSDLLTVLHENAGVAAARHSEVDEEVPLQVVSLADLDALEESREPPTAAVGGTTKEEALRMAIRRVLFNNLMNGSAYRSVHGLIASEVGVLVHAMVCLAKGDRGQTPGDRALVDGVEAGEKAGKPAPCSLRRCRHEGFSGACSDIVERIGPKLDVVVVKEGAGGAWLSVRVGHLE